MKDDRPLVNNSDEVQRFNGFRLSRNGRELHHGTDPRSGHVTPIQDTIDEELSWVTLRPGGAWSGLLIDVERDDGMTWSAMAAERRVLAHARALPLYRLAPDRGSEGLPQIADLF